MNPQELITEQIGLSLETFQMAAESLSELLEQTSELLTASLLQDGKVVVCGMGTSAATASGFAERMLSRFERDRPGLPVLALTNDGIMTSGITQDSSPGDIYARQVRTLCREPDVLLVVTSSGSAAALIKAVQAAHDQGISVIALTGGNGGDVASLLEENDIELRVNSDRMGCVQLTHHLLLNCLVELIENAIFGNEL